MGDTVTCIRLASDKRYYIQMYITLYQFSVCDIYVWHMVDAWFKVAKDGKQTHKQPLFLGSNRLGTVGRRRLGGGPCRCKSVWPGPPSRSWQTTNRLADCHGSSTTKWWESGDWRRVGETKTRGLWACYERNIILAFSSKNLQTFFVPVYLYIVLCTTWKASGQMWNPFR